MENVINIWGLSTVGENMFSNNFVFFNTVECIHQDSDDVFDIIRLLFIMKVFSFL